MPTSNQFSQSGSRGLQDQGCGVNGQFFHGTQKVEVWKMTFPFFSWVICL